MQNGTDSLTQYFNELLQNKMTTDQRFFIGYLHEVTTNPLWNDSTYSSLIKGCLKACQATEIEICLQLLDDAFDQRVRQINNLWDRFDAYQDPASLSYYQTREKMLREAFKVVSLLNRQCAQLAVAKTMLEINLDKFNGPSYD